MNVAISPKDHHPAISIVMPTYNMEKYIRESLDSIISQSFMDYECIIVDDGSTDNTKEIVSFYKDSRFLLVENTHNLIKSLNKGLSMAQGKYIARMDADDVMHPDRLKIQHAIMEAEQQITVCGSWMTMFGKGIRSGNLARSLNGLVDLPLTQFLKGNFVFHPTVMIRKKFLEENNLQYENYEYAEDFQLWVEIAKRGGILYIENQPLLYYRISDDQISRKKKIIQEETTERILQETIFYLFEHNKKCYPELMEILNSFKVLQEKKIISIIDMARIVHNILFMNKSKFQLY